MAAPGARSVRPRRLLHPAAWWLWAGGLAVVALRTTNPLLLGLILGVVVFVVASRRSDAPWAMSFASYLKLGVVVIVIRMIFPILFGNRLPGTELFTIPSVTLPDWAAGVSIGGPVTVEMLVGAFYQGLRLAVVIACVGAANTLCSPYRMLRALPNALYEAGVAVTVALTFAPQLAITARRVREARRLRGRPTRGPSAWRGSMLPVLEGALERAVALAASMDSRGYGRAGRAPAGVRRAAAVLTLVGMVLVAIGTYGVLDPGVPFVLRAPALVAGGAALVAALVMGGRRSDRTRYRPDRWLPAEWVVSLCGVVAVVGVVVSGRAGAGLEPSVYPLEMPELPLAAALGVLVAIVPAWAAPEPPELATVAPAPVTGPALEVAA
jgi:energy-coupling factor transport system permease protein